MRELDLNAVHAAVAGGSVLAAGGGGWVDHGMLVGTTAVQYGTPRLVTLDELDPDAMLATVSAIGAPAAVGWEMRPGDYVRALELLMDAVDDPIIGVRYVLVNGKNVPDDVRSGHEDLSPPFTTYYEQVDGKYWFPTYTKAEGTLHFAAQQGALSEDIHMRNIIRYTDYKRFRANVTIHYNGEEISNKPDATPQPDAAKPNTSKPPQ